MTEPLPGRDELLSMWQDLAGVAPGERLFRTRRLPAPGTLDLRIGLRETDGAPCLVADSEGADIAAIPPFETGGLRLSRARDEAGLLLVLSLEEPARRDLFADICSDLVSAAAEAATNGPAEGLHELADRLGAWRAFLRDQAGGLGRNELVGIAGELVVLGELLRADPTALMAWRAPDDGLYDFQRNGWALEVKTTTGTGSRLHVSNLDQLDDTGLVSLGLAHVRLAEAADEHDLETLSERVVGLLPTDRQRREFRNALLRRGVPPETDETLGLRFRVVGLDVYRVSRGFPRLLRRDVSVGIAEASYEIDVRSLAGHAVTLEDLQDGYPVP